MRKAEGTSKGVVEHTVLVERHVGLQDSGGKASDLEEKVDKFSAHLVKAFPDVCCASSDVLPFESSSLMLKASLVPCIFSSI